MTPRKEINPVAQVNLQNLKEMLKKPTWNYIGRNKVVLALGVPVQFILRDF